ncbi:MAG TPA: hypothetical protein VG944_20030 [Fimbriimonas sp.]|nr:hypothetical protein [Fimbriimonas sp.]
MITQTILTVLLASGNPTFFSAKSLAYQPVDRLQKIVGPVIVLKHVPGVYFQRAGFNQVFVNGGGSGMSKIVIRPEILAGWKKTASDFGIGVAHASAHALGDPPSPIPLIRASAQIVGATGLPINSATHKPWKLVYHEIAVANQGKLRAARAQINGTSGAERIRLIKSCYDWYSELELTAK